MLCKIRYVILNSFQNLSICVNPRNAKDFFSLRPVNRSRLLQNTWIVILNEVKNLKRCWNKILQSLLPAGRQVVPSEWQLCNTPWRWIAQIIADLKDYKWQPNARPPLAGPLSEKFLRRMTTEWQWMTIEFYQLTFNFPAVKDHSLTEDKLIPKGWYYNRNNVPW